MRQTTTTSSYQNVIIVVLVIIISFLMTERLIMYDEENDHYIKGLYYRAKVNGYHINIKANVSNILYNRTNFIFAQPKLMVFKVLICYLIELYIMKMQP